MPSFLATAASLMATFSQPEAASGYTPRSAAVAQKQMVVSAHPLATEAGLALLEKGGSALDAALAMMMVLTLVEPQSSGIGGGGLLLYYSALEGEVFACDGRETAPAAVDENLWRDAQGVPLSAVEAMIGGMSVGVPGLLKMLYLAHSRWGKLPWADLFAPAIRLATEGFPISPRLHMLITTTPRLNTFAKTRAYLFQKNGQPKSAGTLLKNPALARTFQTLAAEGIAPFYSGSIAEAVVAAVRQAPIRPGTLCLDDFKNYTAHMRAPLKTTYDGYTLYGFPPPASGGVCVAQILGMLKHHPMHTHPLTTAQGIHLFAQASRLSFADRDMYIADPAYAFVPTEQLIDPLYLQQRAQLIDLEQALQQVDPGQFPLPEGRVGAPSCELPATTHLCVVDAAGNAVSLTASIENAFGSTLMAEGFFLNNQLTDFACMPTQGESFVANRVEPGKRPMSSMSSAMVFHTATHTPYLIVGSAGGGRIIDYVAKTLLGVLTYHHPLQEAISSPNVAAMGAPVDLEEGFFGEKIAEALEAMDNTVQMLPMTSGTQGIVWTAEGWVGGADPRREGTALGR